MKTGHDKYYENQLKQVNGDCWGAVFDGLVREEHRLEEVTEQALCWSMEEHLRQWEQQWQEALC